MKKWFLAIKERGDDLFDLSKGLEVIEAPNHNTYADPFLLGNYLFFENFDHEKGVIACIEMKDGVFSDPVTVLERPYHLSYPYLLEDEGEIYMIPETLGSNTIEIYRARPFPYRWEFVTVIMKGVAAVDTNIIKYGNEYFLFSTFHGDNNLEIHKSSNLFEGWKLVRRVQIENSRGAGNIFEHEGKLIRPVQRSTKELYGQGIIFREITVDPYTEKEIHRIDPDWMEGLIGTHTFNFNDKYVVVDGKYEA